MNRVFIILFIALLGVATVYADERCGESAWWKFDSNTSPLTIYGSGATYDNSSSRSAFADYNIAKVVVENGITTIEEQLFGECGFSSIELPESLTEIGEGAFAGCKNLVSVKIPNRVMYPGERMFKDCINLREVELPRGLYSVPREAFMNCSSLEKITLPENVMFIHPSAFIYCTSLKSVQTSERLRDIGDMAFYGCTELHDLAIPQSVNNLKATAFGDCGLRNFAVRAELLPNISPLKGLETLTIIKGSRAISEGAMTNCVNLRMVTILACEQIKDRAFEHSTKIDTIITETEGSPVLGNDVFPEVLYDKTKVLVPPGKYERNRDDSGWGKFKNISDAIYKHCAKPVMVEANGYYGRYKFPVPLRAQDFITVWHVQTCRKT